MAASVVGAGLGFDSIRVMRRIERAASPVFFVCTAFNNGHN
jgi:hypothetical protein